MPHGSNLLACCALLVAGSLAAPAARAEVGDYSPFQAVVNLFSPQKANAPFSTADAADVPIEVKANPPGFRDGFRPGSYYVWQEVSLDPSTGAKCADGSPYKIFVNRSPATSNVLISEELGGACWSYETCQSLNPLGARSLPALISQLGDLATQFSTTGHIDGLTAINNSVTAIEPLVLASGLGSTLINRSTTQIRNKVQGWTYVYLPYCTGDTLLGIGPTTYTSADGTKTAVYQHNGIRNTLAAVVWIKNNLEKPGQMMLTGQSAGGVGSAASYFFFRDKLRPTYGYLLDDAGPAFPAPLSASDAQYPSIRLHKKIAQVWHWNDSMPSVHGGTTTLMQWVESQLPGFTRTNFGTVNSALSAKYRSDRLAFISANEDFVFSSYSYRDFYPELADPNTRRALTLAKWHTDIDNLTAFLGPLPNFQYYIIGYRRALDSHTLTTIDAYNTDIEEQGLTLNRFIDNLTAQGAPAIKARERSYAGDYSRTNLLHEISLLALQLAGL
jgi:hypothetical protein